VRFVLVKAVSLFVLGGFVGFWIYVVTALYTVEEYVFPKRARHDAVKALTSTNSTNKLAALKGTFGKFFSFDDGSWLVVRYKDTHSGFVGSYALTRDSDGKWLESKYHFCGMLGYLDKGAARDARLAEELAKVSKNDERESAQQAPDPTEQETGMRRLMEATNAAALGAVLIENFEFHETSVK
jgi:hypothetical protein